MAIDPGQLLKRLEPAVRLTGRTDSPTPQRPLEAQDFDSLLQLVSTGELRSGREVTIGAAMHEPLTDQQLDRLAAAADRAEAAGSKRAVMLMDGRGFVMSIAQRVIESELSATNTTPIIGIDAAVYVAHPDELHGERTLRPGDGLPRSFAVR